MNIRIELSAGVRATGRAFSTRAREWLIARGTLALHIAVYGRRPGRSLGAPASVDDRFASGRGRGVHAMTWFWRVWKTGTVPVPPPASSVHISMNDYLIHSARNVPHVAMAGLRFRQAWPSTEGALGLWVANTTSGRRQISVSIWQTPEHLQRFVRSPAHLKIMREFRDAGDLLTNAWTAERFDRSLIWRQAEDRLLGRVPGVPHH